MLEIDMMKFVLARAFRSPLSCYHGRFCMRRRDGRDFVIVLSWIGDCPGPTSLMSHYDIARTRTGRSRDSGEMTEYPPRPWVSGAPNLVGQAPVWNSAGAADPGGKMLGRRIARARKCALRDLCTQLRPYSPSPLRRLAFSSSAGFGRLVTP